MSPRKRGKKDKVEEKKVDTSSKPDRWVLPSEADLTPSDISSIPKKVSSELLEAASLAEEKEISEELKEISCPTPLVDELPSTPRVAITVSPVEGLEDLAPVPDWDKTCPLSDEYMGFLENMVFIQKPQTIVVLGSQGSGWDIEVLLKGRHQPIFNFVGCIDLEVGEYLEERELADSIMFRHPGAMVSELCRKNIGIDMLILNRYETDVASAVTMLMSQFSEDTLILLTGSCSSDAQDIVRSFRDRPLWQVVELPLIIGRKAKTIGGWLWLKLRWLVLGCMTPIGV